MATRPRRLEPLADEADLLVQARAGDRAAFDRLAQHHRAWLERAAILMVGDEEQAEDLVQEGLGIAFAQIAGFERRSAFSTWLCGIVINLCRKHLRRRARHAAVVDPDLLDAQPAGSARTRGPLSSVLRRELAVRLEDAVARLPIPLREAFLLRFVSVLEYDEIAAAAEITLATARVRVFRARALLRQELGPLVETVWLRPEPET